MFIDNLLSNILNPFMLILSDSLYADIVSQNTFIINFALIWFIAYTILIFLGYVFIWRPIEFKFARDV